MRLAIPAIRQRFPGRRMWAVFEPRSNTTKRKVFQEELPKALGLADGVIVAAVAQPDKIPKEDRLDVDAVVEALRKTGVPAHCGRDTGAIVKLLKEESKSGDVIVIFSNGGFDNIHEKLLATL
jgi:UDP-N-acetylmuramate: L-alanyl-gamma-D-glutamyl-meso-diaminopimelate ligase